MSAATKNLRLNQRQLNVDGIEVGVSRQALEEALLERRWRPIDTAPKGVEVMLYAQGLVYVGRKRGGLYIEANRNLSILHGEPFVAADFTILRIGCHSQMGLRPSNEQRG